MIKKVVIVNIPTEETPDDQYLDVEFTDGTFVKLNEEELKNAAIIARQNALVDDKRQRRGCLGD
jgi:argininosuccinate synthase